MVFTLGVSLLFSAPTMPENTAEKVLTHLLHYQAEAWSGGRLEEFCSVYSDDATFVSPSGVTQGREQILARYRKRYQQDGHAMGTLKLEILNVRVGSGDMAAVAMRWILDWKNKPQATGFSLVTMRQGPKGWHIVQDASM